MLTTPNSLPLQVLRGYKDRTQAVELLRELELFEIEPAPAQVATGVFSRSSEGLFLPLTRSDYSPATRLGFRLGRIVDGVLR